MMHSLRLSISEIQAPLFLAHQIKVSNILQLALVVMKGILETSGKLYAFARLWSVSLNL